AAMRNGRRFPPGLERFLLSTWLRAIVGGLSFAVFAFLWIGTLAGRNDSGVNLTPTVVYVYFWVGMPIASVLFGNIWSVLNPWKAAADGLGWAARRLRIRGEPPFRYPAWLGHWPAAILLLSFVTMELTFVNPSEPRSLALAIAIYSCVTWFG